MAMGEASGVAMVVPKKEAISRSTPLNLCSNHHQLNDYASRPILLSHGRPYSPSFSWLASVCRLIYSDIQRTRRDGEIARDLCS